MSYGPQGRPRWHSGDFDGVKSRSARMPYLLQQTHTFGGKPTFHYPWAMTAAAGRVSLWGTGRVASQNVGTVRDYRGGSRSLCGRVTLFR